MGSTDLSEEDNKSGVLQIHPNRMCPDPSEGWRRGARGALRKSCDACTTSKTKCTGEIPCDRCIKRKLDCNFSKRRRCGPRARTAEEENLLRTQSPDNSYIHEGDMGTPNQGPIQRQLPMHLTSIGPTCVESNSPNMALKGLQLPVLPGGSGQRAAPAIGNNFSAPLTVDSLSGLVELIAPSLSGGGGSGSSSSANGRDSTPAYPQVNTSHPAAQHSYSPQQGPSLGGAASFIGGIGGDPSPPLDAMRGRSLALSSGVAGCGVAGGGGGGGSCAQPSFSLKDDNEHDPNTSARHDQDSMHNIHDSHRFMPPTRSATMPSSIMPSPSSILPTRQLPPRSKSSHDAADFQNRSGENSAYQQPQDVGVTGWVEGGTLSIPGGQIGLPSKPKPLPLNLTRHEKVHLRAFMRSLGSVLLLPGADALRKAMGAGAVDGIRNEGENQWYRKKSGSVQPPKKTNGNSSRNGGPMDRNVSVKSNNPAESFVSVNEKNSNKRGRPEHSSIGDSDDDGDEGRGRYISGDYVDVECRRAEAWAAIAVGTLFGDGGKKEAEEYVSRALLALSRCLDAPQAEVASVMLLLTIFWMHFMDTKKMARYFGFAQQVGLELGPLLPEGLRHSMAFVSILVTMTLNLNQGVSLALQVRDHGVWGVALHGRPGIDPVVRALAVVTIACDKMLHDGLRSPSNQPRGASEIITLIPPSQTATDGLQAAAESLASLSTSNTRDADGDGEGGAIQNPDHLLALLYGLKGYTHATRDEVGEAESCGKLMLQIVDRNATVLHLPLTFTLAEASRKLLQHQRQQHAKVTRGPRAKYSARPHLDYLRCARDNLVFARAPSVGVTVSSDVHGSKGGWCAFGDAILAAFEKGHASVEGNVSSPKMANSDKEPSRPVASKNRASSMSPPPDRSSKPLSRADIASQRWRPSSERLSNKNPCRSTPELSPSASRWSPSLGPRFYQRPLLNGSAVAAHATVDEEATDWVDRVRKLPIMNSRPHSPGIVHRMPSDSRTPPPGECPTAIPPSLQMLGPGPMPPGPPNHTASRFMSEPPGLALLSGVAAPGAYSSTPRRASYEDRGVEERELGPRRSGNGRGSGGGVGYGQSPGHHSGGGGGGSGNGGGAGGSVVERDGSDGDFPPTMNPGLAAGVSFDPNRDDPSFNFELR